MFRRFKDAADTNGSTGTGANSEIRTRDLRFTKPNAAPQVPAEIPQKPGKCTTGKHGRAGRDQIADTADKRQPIFGQFGQRRRGRGAAPGDVATLGSGSGAQDIHERPTVAIRLKYPCPCCDDAGFLAGVLDSPWVVLCGCTSGLRIKCATQQTGEPMRDREAAKVARRIGLQVQP